MNQNKIKSITFLLVKKFVLKRIFIVGIVRAFEAKRCCESISEVWGN